MLDLYSHNVIKSTPCETAIDGSRFHAENQGTMPRARKITATKPRRYADIGWRLKQTREALGATQAEICKPIKCKQPRWNQYETGDRKITTEIAVRLCDTYDLTMDWIYRGKIGPTLPVWLLEKLYGKAN
jgi:DNA-binding XRE family transcriptional regulator